MKFSLLGIEILLFCPLQISYILTDVQGVYIIHNIHLHSDLYNLLDYVIEGKTTEFWLAKMEGKIDYYSC